MPYKDKETAKIKQKEYRERNHEKIYASQRLWYLNNKTWVRDYLNKWEQCNPEKGKKYNKDYRLRVRALVLKQYGKGEIKCVRCGESRIPCLSIDHINGGGNTHRKEINKKGLAFYNWLRQNDFPDGYQTLCMNCQFMKKIENREQEHSSVA